MAHKGESYTVVVSDDDSFDAVLPVRTVRYIYVRPPKPVSNSVPLVLSYMIHCALLLHSASVALLRCGVLAIPICACSRPQKGSGQSIA